MISSRYDHIPAHYRFARVRTGVAPEPLRPLTSWLQEIGRAAAVGLLVTLLWALATVLI